MNKILSNIVKGLLVAFVIVLTGGIFSLNMKVPLNTSMKLVSSSIVNSVKTDTSDEKSTKEIETQEETEEKETVVETFEESKDVKTETNVDKEEDKEEIKIEKKEEKTVQEESFEKEEEKEEETKEIQVVTPPEVVETPPKEETIPTPKDSYSPNLEVVGSTIETYHGVITAYGPDCYGCTTGATASGYNVLNGNIYYNDPTYGTIRIVAADRSLPFGTIVKITGLNISTEPVLAIVLDRGGDIGFNKSIYFDLLFTSEKSSDVYNFGKQTATFEILRRGY